MMAITRKKSPRISLRIRWGGGVEGSFLLLFLRPKSLSFQTGMMVASTSGLLSITL